MVLHYRISPCAMRHVAHRRGLAGLLRYVYGRKPIEDVQFFILRNNARLAFQTYQRAASHATCINKYWPKQGVKVLINIQKATGSSVVDELSGRNSVFFRSTYLPVSQRITTERSSAHIFMEYKRPSNARRKAVFYCASGGILARR